MPEMVTLQVDEREVHVPLGTTVAAAAIAAGKTFFRRSVGGSPRGPLCGIGICFECRVTLDGQPHRRSCQILCQNGMKIVTDGG